jgi:RNA polymerase sigma-54 factor
MQAACAALAQLVTEEVEPRSDRDLAEELGRRGYLVARRTVAKYRDRLGIPACAIR